MTGPAPAGTSQTIQAPPSSRTFSTCGALFLEDSTQVLPGLGAPAQTLREALPNHPQGILCPDIQFHFLQSTSLPPVTVLASCLMPPPHSEDREGGRGLAGTFPSSPKCPSCPARVSKQTSDVPRAMVGSALRWLSPWNFQASSLCPQAATPRSHCLCPCSAAMIALPQVGMCSRDPGSQEGHLLRISC